MLYASDLTRFKGAFSSLVDGDIDDLPDLVAQLLAATVEERLRRNLTRGYRCCEMPVARVRGAINVLQTKTRLLLEKGEVFCRFQDLTIDTTHNRLVRVALDLMARLVQSEDLARRCRSLALCLARYGVVGLKPSRADLACGQISRNNERDRVMVALAQLAFDLALPTEESGPVALVAPEREEIWIRRLFEKAVLGFARIELEPLGWSVQGGVALRWQVASPSGTLLSVLPRMVTDIVLGPPRGPRIVVDTKFSSILGSRRFGGASLKSEYIYQMYAYVRSQEGLDGELNDASGLFLHPAIDVPLYEKALIQGHSITFATVNLADSPVAVRSELRKILRAQAC